MRKIALHFPDDHPPFRISEGPIAMTGAAERRSVLGRALRILDAVKDSAGGLSLSEISRRSGVPLTTAHRIVSELHEWGALERDASGAYQIGLRLWELATVAPRSVGLQRVALPFMRDLFETTHRGVHLAIRDKDQVVFVERLLSPETVTDRAQVGVHYELHATAIGLVLLAYAPRSLQEEVLTGPLVPPNWHSPITGRELRQALAHVRLSGYAATPIREEYLSVAAPIHGPVHGSADAVVGALSLILPISEPYGPRLAHLQATVRGISRALGTTHGREAWPPDRLPTGASAIAPVRIGAGCPRTR
jgi:DNA-binding IclR family transcriptional regulator